MKMTKKKSFSLALTGLMLMQSSQVLASLEDDKASYDAQAEEKRQQSAELAGKIESLSEEKRILEVNPAHPLIAKVKALEGDAFGDAVALLYDSALIAEGSPVEDGARFAKLLAGLMMK